MGARKSGINNNNHEGVDIVCGRGKGYDLLPGNRSFKRIIQEHATEYSELSRANKTKVVRQISSYLTEQNMRFVKPGKKGMAYVLLPKREANIKIGHALRDVKTIRKKQQHSRAQKEKSANQKTGSYDSDSVGSGASSSSESSVSATIAPISPVPISDIYMQLQPPLMLLDKTTATDDDDNFPLNLESKLPGGIERTAWSNNVASTVAQQNCDTIPRANQHQLPTIFRETTPLYNIGQHKVDNSNSSDDLMAPLDIATDIQWNDSLTSNDVEDLLKICSTSL